MKTLIARLDILSVRIQAFGNDSPTSASAFFQSRSCTLVSLEYGFDSEGCMPSKKRPVKPSRFGEEARYATASAARSGLFDASRTKNRAGAASSRIRSDLKRPG